MTTVPTTQQLQTLQHAHALTKRHGLNTIDKLVLINLMRNGQDRPISNAALAKLSCCTITTVTRSIKHLVALGLIIKNHHRDEDNNGEWMPSSYTVSHEAITDKATASGTRLGE